jgi:hypothetical protein
MKGEVAEKLDLSLEERYKLAKDIRESCGAIITGKTVGLTEEEFFCLFEEADNEKS